MNRGYSWGDAVDGRFPFGGVWKRQVGDILHTGHPRSGFECLFCGRVFYRKHVRWVGEGAHEQLKAEDHIKREQECARISAENDDLRRRLDGVRYWLDVKDTITGDR